MACGSAFLEDGKEYVYEEEGAQISATLDHQPTAAGRACKGRTRMQVRGNKINVKVNNFLSKVVLLLSSDSEIG